MRMYFKSQKSEQFYVLSISAEERSSLAPYEIATDTFNLLK